MNGSSRGASAPATSSSWSGTTNATLAPREKGPYLRCESSPLPRTKGGPRIDAEGRVLHASGEAVIRDLHAADNSAASPLGMACPGAGGIIGAALLFGMRVGVTAAK